MSTVHYRKLLKFFFPLAVTPFVIASSQSLINASMARLPSPELSIAAFSVIQSLTNIVKAPGLLSKQLNVSLVDSPASLKLMNRFLIALCSLYVGSLMLLGYTPLGAWVLQRFFGLSDPDVLSFAILALRITCFLPIFEMLRHRFQGLAAGVRKTELVSLGSLMRLISLSIFLVIVVRFNLMSGILVAAISWLVGIAIEGLFLAGTFRRFIGPASYAASIMPKRHEKPLKMKGILLFFLPLALMMTLEAFFLPYMQSTIAKGSINVTQSLAAFGVAWGIFLLLANPIKSLHSCSLVFINSEDSIEMSKVRNFSLAVGLLFSVILLIIGITPVGYWIIRHLIGVSEEIAQIARGALLTFSLYPILRSLAEFYWGILMSNQNTSVIGIGKVLNMGSAIITLTLLIGPLYFLLPIQPAMLCGIAYSIGQGVECIFLWHNAKAAVLKTQKEVTA